MRHRWWKGVAGSLIAASIVLLAGSIARAQDIEKWFGEFRPHAVWYQQAGGSDQPMDVGAHWIGVLCHPADDLAKAQLKLDHGLAVDRVVPDAPADKAGIEQHDILLSLGEKKLERVLDLVEAVKATEGKQTTLKLIRGGKELSLKLTPAKRPKEDPVLRFAPAPDHETIKKWFEEFVPEEHGRVPLRLQRFRPGVVMPDSVKKKIELPDNLSISVTKQGSEKAKIIVKRGDDTWEATEDNLDAIPEDIRPHVVRLLGRGSVIEFEPLKWIPEGMQDLPHIKQHLRLGPAAQVPVHPVKPSQELGKAERRMREQLQQMRRSLDHMQRELDQFRNRAQLGNAKDDGVGAEVVPVKPEKKSRPKKDEKK